MKTNKILGMIALSVFAIACTQEAPEKDTTPAKLLSFGFYAEDNAELLEKDYVATIGEENSIIIRLPEGARTSEALVARVEAGEKDVVKIDGEEAADGKITVNPLHPIDVIVTNTVSNLSAAYEIKVGKFLGYTLNKIATYEESGYTLSAYAYMEINPKDGMPYIAYYRKKEAGEDDTNTYNYQASVTKWNGTGFEFVGKSGFSGEETDAQVYRPTLCFDKDGVPYVVYVDKANGTRLSAKVFSGNSWKTLGSLGFGISDSDKSNTSYEPLIFCNGSNVYAFYPGSVKTESSYRVLSEAVYSGSDWTVNVKPGTPDSSKPYIRSRAVSVGDATYMISAFNGVYYLFKYENGTSEIIINNGCEGSTHFTSISIDADSQGNLYSLLVDKVDSDAYNINLYKYDLENKTMLAIARVPGITVSAMGGVYQDFAVNPVDGTIAAMYIDSNKNLFFGSLDQDSGRFDEFVQVGETTVNQTHVYIDFAPDGTGYAAVVNADKKIDLYKVQKEDDILPE